MLTIAVLSGGLFIMLLTAAASRFCQACIRRSTPWMHEAVAYLVGAVLMLLVVIWSWRAVGWLGWV